MDTLAYAIAVEEIGRVWGSLGLIVAAHTSLGCGPLMIAGTDEQRDRWLTPLASGEVIGAYGLTEPSAGSDAGGTRTTARREDGPDGGTWVIDGQKRFITNAGHAGTYVITARTGDDRRRRGADLRVHRPGRRRRVQRRTARGEDGPPRVGDGRAAVRRRARPGGQPAGRGGRRLPARSSRCSTAAGSRSRALALGLAQAALDAAVPYAKEREQFGRPIGTFQGVAFMIADMATEIEAARALVYRVGVAQGPGPRLRAGVGAGQAVRVRGLVAGHQRRDPGPRRLRLHRGLQGRAVPARREADRDRRGDEPGPAARDRAQDPGPADRLTGRGPR